MPDLVAFRKNFHNFHLLNATFYTLNPWSPLIA